MVRIELLQGPVFRFFHSPHPKQLLLLEQELNLKWTKKTVVSIYLIPLLDNPLIVKHVQSMACDMYAPTLRLESDYQLNSAALSQLW